MTPIPQFFKYDKHFPKYLIQNDNNFCFEKRAAKKTQLFLFLKDSYFVMGGPIDMNVGVFFNFSQNIAKVMPI